MGREQSLGYDLLCLTHPGSVALDKVTPTAGSHGVVVDAFAVRPNPYVRHQVGLGLLPGVLAQNGFGTGRSVSSLCRGGDGAELGVQLHTTTAVAHLAGLRLSYRIAHIPWSLTIRMDDYWCATTAVARPCNPQ